MTAVQLPDHLKAEARRHGWAEGLDLVLAEIADITRLIAAAVRRGALQTSLMGLANYQNVQGEEVQKLDEWSNALLCDRLTRSGLVGALASEEVEEPMYVGEPHRIGDFIVMFDPLDGSSNIDVNATIGTIFGVYHWPRSRGPHPDLKFRGSDQVAAGYAAYGSATMLVYTARNGVHGFTLDPALGTAGEYVQTHPDIRCPERASQYSCNEGNRCYWSDAQTRLVAMYQQNDKAERRPYSARYIGSLVADFHRVLLKGGIFMYPADAKSRNGKLRYLYEAAPLSLVCEQAGGASSDGSRRMLEIAPDGIHQRVPLFIGSRGEVELAVQVLSARDQAQS